MHSSEKNQSLFSLNFEKYLWFKVKVFILINYYYNTVSTGEYQNSPSLKNYVPAIKSICFPEGTHFLKPTSPFQRARELTQQGHSPDHFSSRNTARNVQII